MDVTTPETNEVANGTLLIRADGNTVKSSSETGADLQVNSGVTSTEVLGKFNAVSGTVQLSGAAPIAITKADSANIDGNNKKLELMSGTATLVGAFQAVDLGDNVTLTISNPTDIQSLNEIGIASWWVRVFGPVFM